MTQDPHSKEFADILNCLFNETMTAAQHQRLEELLNSNPQRQDAYFHQLDLHLALRQMYAEEQEPDPVADAAIRKLISSRGVGSRRQYSRKTEALLVASLVFVLTAVPLLLLNSLRRSEVSPFAVHQPPATENPSVVEPVPAQSDVMAARLLQSAGAELLHEYVPQIGSRLKLQHEYVLVKGMLELEFGNGARTILEAPAVFHVESPERLDLKIGKCSVYAPEGAQGFEVLTPRNRVVDLGTRFSIDVNDFGHSEIQVVEGAAQVYQDREQTDVRTLTQGEATRCAGSAEGMREIQFDPRHYHRSLPDRVISYEAELFQGGPGVRDLTSVTVQRGGQIYTYPVDQLIGVDLLHFRSHSNRNSVASDEEMLTNPVEFITRDRALNTGIINFDRPQDAPDTTEIHEDYRQKPGMAVKFRHPLRNSPGPDLVLFEIQSVVYPVEGDHFRVSPLAPAEGLRAHFVTKFDITLNSENARPVAPFRVFTFDGSIDSPEDLLRPSSRRGGGMSLPFYALAVGVDLSDLGYAPDAEVSGLFFEDANHTDFVVIDPVFIGGFPAFPETSLTMKTVD